MMVQILFTRGAIVAAPWESQEMKDLAAAFIQEEDQAGRTYRMVEVERLVSGGNSMSSFVLESPPETQVDGEQFSHLVTDFMRRRNWPEGNGGVEGWLETVEMAIMCHVRDRQEQPVSA
jgi:hypothetical protein